MGKPSDQPRLRSRAALLLGAALMLSLVLTGPAGGPVSLVNAQTAPAPVKEYVLVPGDTVDINVFGEADLTRSVVIRPDGKISLPLIGELQAGGLTPEQLRQSVHKALLEHMNRPEVMILVQQVLSKKFYISGEVMRPGTYPLVVPTTVLEALANAGGFKEFVNKKKIRILRGTEQLKFNYNDVMKGKNLEQNVYLKDGDHIFVPE